MRNRVHLFWTILLSWIMFATNTGFAYGADDAEEAPEWVLSYAAVGMCIALGIIVIVRSSKRSDSIISEYDRQRQQEDELKKLGKH